MNHNAWLPPVAPERSPEGIGEFFSCGDASAVRAEQVRLLYVNANVAVVVTVLVSAALSHLEWPVISHAVVLGWLAYMILEALGVFVLARRFWRTPPDGSRLGWWDAAFTAGSALSAAGWGGAGILLYPAAHVTHQLPLAFVIGGMMLGGASILASRPPAFVSFMLLAGVPLAARFLLQDDDLHLAYGMLILLFISAVLITTWHIYQAVGYALMLRFENHELAADLRSAQERLEELSERLEQRATPAEAGNEAGVRAASAATPGRSRRGRKSMGLDERKEVSARMKRYWAQIRQQGRQ